MRFPEVWAQVLSQNVTLRGALLALSLSLVTVSIAALKFGLRDPMIIERGCSSTRAQTAPATVTDDEIKAFVREVIPQRFDSEREGSPAFMAQAQLKAKATEAEDLRRKGMRQLMIVGSVSMDGAKITVEADRLIAVDKIRSAFPMTLDVTVEKTSRSEANPYGLILTKVTPLESKETWEEIKR